MYGVQSPAKWSPELMDVAKANGEEKDNSATDGRTDGSRAYNGRGLIIGHTVRCCMRKWPTNCYRRTVVVRLLMLSTEVSLPNLINSRHFGVKYYSRSQNQTTLGVGRVRISIGLGLELGLVLGLGLG